MPLPIHTQPSSLSLPSLLLLFLLLLFTPSGIWGSSQPPNIVVIMADDLGWNDVGYRHPGNQMVTPYIDQLAGEGVKLNFSYMLKSCTPSRSTFMTGVYAFRMGLQDKSLHAANNYSIPLDRRLFPEELQDNGYSTHFVGKWHLGFCRHAMTPTHRGFDTFYGKYNGAGDHFTHISKMKGYDVQDDNATHYGVDWSADGQYSTEIFTNRSVQIIHSHPKDRPLFLFLSYQAVHGPLQVPSRYITQYCSHVTHGGDARKIHCAMTAAMDEGIGQVVTALSDTGLSDNLILFFTTDNGGPYNLGSSNWPLRGTKITEWEGGTRAVGFLHSTRHLPNAPYTWNGVIHAKDWYPTILSMANITTDNTNIDGVDNWESIVNNEPSKTTEFVYNSNSAKDNYSLRWKQYKLVNFSRPAHSGWLYPPPGETQLPDPPSNENYTTMLFDIDKDPLELNNLYFHPNFSCVVKVMEQKLRKYESEAMFPEIRPKLKELAHPKNFNGAWSTGWC